MTASPPPIQVIVTCTDRKRVDVPEDLCLRVFAPSRNGDRVVAWTAALEESPEARHPAEQVYGGSHWSAARELPKTASTANATVQVWISSAGYGLISPATEIAGYAATFSPESEDSVSSETEFAERVAATERWWEGLTKWKGPAPAFGTPRSLTQLARKYPQSPILVAASPAYLRAMRKDLLGAASELDDPEQLSIISGGTQRLPGLDNHLLPIDGRLRSIVGGAMPALNVRVLGYLLKSARSGSFQLKHLRRRFQRLLEQQPELEKFDRKPMTDEEVRAFILQERDIDPEVRHTPLLRRLRDSGRACEQSRFRQIFRELTSD